MTKSISKKFRRYAADVAERVADLEAVYDCLSPHPGGGPGYFDRILSEMGIDLEAIRAERRAFRKRHPPEWTMD